MLGFNIAENLHVFPVIPATAGAIDSTGRYVNMGNAAHIDFVISFGTTAATATIQVLQACSAAGASAAAMAFSYYAETTDDGDTPAAAAAGAATGVITSANNDIFYVVSVDAGDMTDTYHYIAPKVSNAGANSHCAVAIMSGLRYKEGTPLTVKT